MAEGPWLGRGAGKLILVGEHAVVYGHEAIALAVSRGTTVQLHPLPGPTLLGRSAIQDGRLAQALAIALPAEGLRVDIDSDLPVGRGMGSSAALTIALLRAAAARQGQSPTFAQLYAGGFEVERVFHGRPSGVDHAVSALGGAVSYRRRPEGPELLPLGLPALPLVVLDSGRAGDTAQMVAGVAARRPGVEPQLEAIGALVPQVRALLQQPQPDLPALGQALLHNHALLRQIGVSTPELDSLVALALSAGALGAKLAGAGGGGVVLALCPEPEGLLRAAERAGLGAFAVELASADRLGAGAQPPQRPGQAGSG